MERKGFVVLDVAGNAVRGASVLIKTYPAGVNATLYDDNEVDTIDNPMTTDSTGQCFCKAPNGHYSQTISKTGITTETQNDIVFFDQTDTAATPLATYTELRAYTGNSKQIYITGYSPSAAPSGIAGTFVYDLSDTTSADNGGTIIVATNGKRWKRIYGDEVYVPWFETTGNGTANDTTKLQAAISVGKNVKLAVGETYGITAQLTVSASNVTISGGGTIKPLASYDVSGGTLSAMLITGENVTIDAVTFNGTSAPSGATNNRFVWCTAPRLTVTKRASFISLPVGGSNFNGAIGCSSLAPYARVIGAYFNSNPGAIFFQGRNCLAHNNVIINPKDVAIAFNGINCYGCEAIGNTINNEAFNSCSALIAAEEGASQWVIEGNTLFGIKNGAGIYALNVAVLTTVRGGTIRGNKINGGSGTTTNPCAGISVSNYYTRVEVEGNDVYGMPTGNAATRLYIVPSNGGALRGNIIDGTSATDVSAMVDINAGVLGIDIENNYSVAAAGRRHFLLGAGDYAAYPVTFTGGRFYGGAEGINAQLNAGSIVNPALHIRNITDSTVTSIVNASTILGSRHDWLNAGAWARPHWIGVFTEMYGTGAPASGTFQNGDRIHYLTPAAGTPEGIIRVAGVWRDLANIS